MATTTQQQQQQTSEIKITKTINQQKEKQKQHIVGDKVATINKQWKKAATTTQRQALAAAIRIDCFLFLF